jgi:5-methylcytosine-specific restriction endonuclease McrA
MTALVVVLPRRRPGVQPAAAFTLGRPPFRKKEMPSRPPQHRPPWLKPRLIAERERRAVIDSHRPSSRERGYDAEWQRLRVRFLKAFPLCCAIGCGRLATDVDHIKPIRDRPDLRLDWSNLRPLCRSHHAARTAREQGFGRSVE